MIGRAHGWRLCLWLWLLMAGHLYAADQIALVIGNSAYEQTTTLQNPGNDARDVASALTEIGFAVEPLILDASKGQMEAALAEFAGKAATAQQALVYFAGHGAEANGENYLLPVEARLRSERTVSLEAIKLSDVMAVVSGASELGLVVLDACRNNPLASRMSRADPTRAASRGLAPVEPGGNLLVAYAAEAGSLASDGSARNSPFSAAVLQTLRGEPLEVRMFWGRVRDMVWSATSGEQRPNTYGTLGGEAIYLAGRRAPDQPAQGLTLQPVIANDLETARALIKDRKYSLAVAPLERAVAAGDAEAMWELTELFGKPGVAEDDARSVQLLKLAAELGQPDAMLDLALAKLLKDKSDSDEDEIRQDVAGAASLLQRLQQRPDHWAPLARVFLGVSDLVSRDEQWLEALLDPKMVEVLEASASAGNEPAAVLLLYVYFASPEGRQDRVRGHYWASRLADRDLDEGQYYLSMCLLAIDCGVPADTDRGWTLMRQSAAQGNARANYVVGTTLASENRFGIAPDRVAAIGHLKLAAEDGDEDAMLLLAQIAVEEEQHDEARRWIGQASESGDPQAQNLHALALIEGRYGYSKDVKTGVAMIQQAADAGDASAQGNLADYYWGDKQGLGVRKDHSKARHYYELAAAQGNYLAQVGLGYMHFNGEAGLAKDSQKAAELFRQAADAGYAVGQMEYAYYLAYKAKDPVQARRYFELAVAQGSAAALRGLGELYLDGLGVVPDRARAMELLQSASRQGDQAAKDLLERLGQPPLP